LKNLRPLLEFASSRVGYAFDELDWDAVSVGAGQTDIEADAWFEYRITGHDAVQVAVADNPGSGVVFVRMAAAGATLTALEAAVMLMQDFVLRP
jgi:hypothetical protein